jgi:hypothetical protein
VILSGSFSTVRAALGVGLGCLDVVFNRGKDNTWVFGLGVWGVRVGVMAKS